MTSLLESSWVAPPPGALTEQSLPLTFLDTIWLHFHPIRRLLFYEFPCSKVHFLETLVPKLKHSLSLTLKHYFPLSSNLVYPANTQTEKPVIRYVPGDSVSLKILDSTADFDYLVGNHARDADMFYDFIPQLPPIVNDNESNQLLHVLALQVTLFPGRGICIGFANHHCVGDATSVVGFINTWASISKFGGDLEGQISPLFDRSLIKDPFGVLSIFWDHMKGAPLTTPSFILPTNRVRATYVLTQSHLKKFKDKVVSSIPGLVYISSFVVTAAYIWTCLIKSLDKKEEEHDDEAGALSGTDFFLFAVDSRARLDPPLPAHYFGNCLSYGLVKIENKELVGDEGFFLAAETIANEIHNKVNDKEKILKGAENWMTEISWLFTQRVLSVSGSARVDLYNTADFGWGKARKLEILSIDKENYAMSLCKSRDSDGGLEVGLSLPRATMDAFATRFADGIKN